MISGAVKDFIFLKILQKGDFAIETGDFLWKNGEKGASEEEFFFFRVRGEKSKQKTQKDHTAKNIFNLD